MEWPSGNTQDFRDGVTGSFVVTRLVSFDRRIEKGKDITWTAMPGEKYFKACTRGLDRFNKDELVLVRNDHRQRLYRSLQGSTDRRIVIRPAGTSQLQECERIEEGLPDAQGGVALCKMAASFCCRRMNVFGSRPDADEARRKRTQRRKPLKEPQ